MSLADTADPTTARSSSTASMTASASPVSSPTLSPPMQSAGTSAAAKRAPRKSTLTQQQKNNKRQRATQDQLSTLEIEFNKNPTPTGPTRERIAQEINMTERSVQIWFQNRRAKIKMLAKKSIETGEGCDSIPESMRQYLAMHFDPNKAGARDPLGRPAGGVAHGLYPVDAASSGKVVIHHFTCRSLTIGSWRRIGQNAMDLVVFYSPEKACMTYYINNDSAGYKIEYPFAYIKNITLDSGEQGPLPDGVPPRPSGLVVELNRPPLFFMDSSNSGGFYQCGDFTEDQQASQVMVHHLGGHPKVLSVQLAKLVSLESFRNRMAYNHLTMPPPPAVVSAPFISRPASQPNQFVAPFVGVYSENYLGVNAPAARGHKRQRSRSVPVAVDFAAMQPPAAVPFSMAPTSNPYHAESGIFAPVPQAASAMIPNLRIDTSTEYAMDFRAHPMSAATTGSPSEFASPSMMSATGQPGDSTPVPHLTTQFHMPYISTSMEPSGATVQSPYPVSPADPMIAEHSPPLSYLPHAGSDLVSYDLDQQPSYADDGLMLSDMYSKQNLGYSVQHGMSMDNSSFDLPMHGLHMHSPPDGQEDYQEMAMLGANHDVVTPGP